MKAILCVIWPKWLKKSKTERKAEVVHADATLSVSSYSAPSSRVTPAEPLSQTPPAPRQSDDQTKIVVVDDDELAHFRWQSYFSEQGFSSEKVKYFFSGEDFCRWHRDVEAQFKLLMDYDLKETETGLQIIERLHLNEDAILATFQADNPKVIDACQKAGVILLDKGEIEQLPIETLSVL